MPKASAFATILLLASGIAVAQAQTPPAATGPGNKAINSSGTNNAASPVAGANSFTENEARSRIEAKGFSDVSALAKDANGIWRGKAQKDGAPVNVSLDFQGNVIAQ